METEDALRPETDEHDFCRRLLFTLADLSPRELVFVQGFFKGLSKWDAAVRAGYRRNDALRRLKVIVNRHPEFNFLLDTD